MHDLTFISNHVEKLDKLQSLAPPLSNHPVNVNEVLDPSPVAPSSNGTEVTEIDDSSNHEEEEEEVAEAEKEAAPQTPSLKSAVAVSPQPELTVRTRYCRLVIEECMELIDH